MTANFSRKNVDFFRLSSPHAFLLIKSTPYGINKFIEDGFGGVECLKKDIMYDFFKSGFDGSGADNFYDAGSCIDGRLTSAWNWCSQLPEKPFFCIFKLTGFIGFDGEFK